MHISNLRNSLQFHYDFAIAYKISDILFFQRNTFIINLKALLAFERDASLSKFTDQGFLINGL